MRKFFVFVVMSGVLGFVAPGCALSTGDEPQGSQYGFTRDSTGQARQTDPASLGNFTPAQSFDHSIASKSESAATEVDGQAVACFGVCDANTCVCSGDFDCCLAGCIACWAVVD